MIKKISKQQIQHLSKLSNIPITDRDIKELARTLTETFKVINQLQKFNVKKIKATDHVSNLINIWRSDEIDAKNMLTQKEALKNAHASKDGYFVIPSIKKNNYA